MPNIDLNKVIPLTEQHEFWAIRGKAIQAYANLEQSLSSMFSVLAGTSRATAAITLFRISSSDARNKILERLFRQKFGSQYNLFRNSLFDQLRPLDIERNEIVHWNAVCSVSMARGEESADVYLAAPAALFTDPKNAPTKNTKQILAFSEKCDFYSRLMNMFTSVEGTDAQLPDADKLPWRDIFSQPIAYPPPLDHPLSRNGQALENHIQSFVVID